MVVFRRKLLGSEVSGCESGISDSSSVSEIDEEDFQETESSDVSSESVVTQVKM
jgi:hypothetical protein